jgi:hypothetical protein
MILDDVAKWRAEAELWKAERDNYANDCVALLTRLTEVELERDRLAVIVDLACAEHQALKRWNEGTESDAGVNAAMDARISAVAAEVARRAARHPRRGDRQPSRRDPL